MFRNTKRSTVYLILSLVTIGFKTAAQAADGTIIKFNDIIKEVVIKGDLRLRHESIHRSDKPSSPAATSERNRHRQRFRLRLQSDFKLPNNLEAKLQFASGTGEQVSTNQSLDNLSNEKGIWIDRAFLQWKPMETVTLMAGKMANPLWRPYSSDILWDADFNPEGAGQSFHFFGPLQTKIFINAMQMVVDEDSAGTQDQAEFSGQIGAEALVLDESKFTFAVGVHEWINERVNNFGQGVSGPTVGQDGNRRVTNVSTQALTNEFRVVEYTGEFNSKILSVPISLQGTFIHNTKSRLIPPENDGFQYGAIIGKASQRNGIEVAYFYKRSETDATVADVADSDFGSSGGTNRKGHIMWAGYGLTDFATLSAKHCITKTVNFALFPGIKPVNRTQVDLQVKF